MTPVKGDDLMDKCKSQTVALFLMGRITLIKFVKNPGLNIRWDTDTGILHTDRQPSMEALMVISPPAGVNLIALSMRLLQIWEVSS